VVILSLPVVRRNVLIAIAIQSLPGEPGRGAALLLEVLQLDIRVARIEKYYGRVSGRGLEEPLVNYQLATDPEPDSVVSGDGESVGARCWKVDPPRPARREVVRARAADSAGAAVAEVHIEEADAVVANHCYSALDLGIVVILSQPMV